MLTRLSLRLRIFLFFALLGLGSTVLLAAGLTVAATRHDLTDSTPLVTGGLIASFGILALTLAVWRLFDEHVALAIQKISNDLRARAHAEVDRAVDPAAGRYLGDLAPAAEAAAGAISEVRGKLDLTVAQQTRRLQEQTAQLSALLSDVPAGLILCSPAHKIVFYNAPAISLLADTGRPRLDRSIFDLLRAGPVRRTYRRLLAAGDGPQDGELLVSTTGCGRAMAAHMRLVSGALGIGETPGYVLTLRDVSSDLKLHAERERLLGETLASLRGPAASLRALLDVSLDEGGDPGLEAAMRDEAVAIVTAVESVARRHDALQDTWWPMQDVRASHLVDAMRGQLGPTGPTIDAPTAFFVIRCDGYALANLMAALIEKTVALGLAEAFSVAFIEETPGLTVEIGWQGMPLPVADLHAVLEEPIADSHVPVTGREILDHHNTDLWPESRAQGRAALVLPLPEARRSQPIDLGLDDIPERPAVFDFALLNQSRGGPKSGKRLSELTYVVFDTETTGLDPNGGDEIVQIAAVRIMNGRCVAGEEFDELVDPERPIPAASTRVHGIDDAMVAGKPPIREVGARFHRFCEDAVLVAHNAPFDMAFFHRHADAIGVRFDHPVFDTVLLSAILFGQQESHTLDALADRFGIVIPEEQRHTARGDTVATAEVFQRMLAMLEARGIDTFDAVMEAMGTNSRLMREMRARVG